MPPSSKGLAPPAPEVLDYAPASVDRRNIDRTPESYRSNLVRLMALQAYAERLGVVELSQWVDRAPDYRYRRMFANIASDEANHAYWLYRELERIGVSEADALAIAEAREGAGANGAAMAGPKAVADADNTWEDVVLNNMFLDRAGRHMVTNFAVSSYAPWARVSRRILKDERMHEGFGLREFRRLARERGRDAAFIARTLKWYFLGLNFFGPPTSSKTQMLKDYGLKRLENEQLRLQYRAECEQIFKDLGLADALTVGARVFPYVA